MTTMKPSTQVIKFTKTEIEKIEAGGKRQVFFDDKLTGFALRVAETGRKTFYFTYRPGKGRGVTKQWVMLGAFPEMTVDQARALVKQKTADVQNGQDPATQVREEKSTLTVAEALDGFKEQHISKLKPRTIEGYNDIIRLHLVPNLGKIRVNKLTFSEIARFHTGMAATPYQANRCIAVLSCFLNWCEKSGYRDKNTNPCQEITLYPEHAKQEFMGEDELAALGDALSHMEEAQDISPNMAAAIRLLLFTGTRRNEILTLKWSQVDLVKGVAHLPDSKTGFRVVQLPAAAIAVLEGLPQINEWCFPAASASGHTVNLKKSWQKVLKQSGLTGWRLHDIRHAFASVMAGSGASLIIIGKILGHKQLKTTQRYAHLTADPARLEAEKAAARIAEALQPTPEPPPPSQHWKITRLRRVGNDS